MKTKRMKRARSKTKRITFNEACKHLNLAEQDIMYDKGGKIYLKSKYLKQ